MSDREAYKKLYGELVECVPHYNRGCRWVDETACGQFSVSCQPGYDSSTITIEKIL